MASRLPLLVARNGRSLVPRTSSRSLSTSDSSSEQASKGDGTDNKPPVQPFVTSRFQPGEWNYERTDPLYRPKWANKTKLISAEDFANRPTVGFSCEFESYQEGMVTLSWLDRSEQQQIYQLYTELMNHSQQKHGKTSHEYIMRVIAQKFNITAERTAATVQLMHNEQQILKNEPDRELLDDLADAMDYEIKETIRDAYSVYRMKAPDSFVETPAGIRKDSKKWSVVEDLFDVDELMKDTIVRDEHDARLQIDGKIYIEDVDEDKIPIKLSKDCKKLLKAQKDLAASTKTLQSSTTKWPQKEESERRPRWKYVAQTVNVRELKKQNKKRRSYKNNNPINTLVEHDGTLRAGNMADVKMTAWKPVRNEQEHTYGRAKKAWLDLTVRGETGAWGKAPENRVQREGNFRRYLEEGPNYRKNDEAAMAAAKQAEDAAKKTEEADAEDGTGESSNSDTKDDE